MQRWAGPTSREDDDSADDYFRAWKLTAPVRGGREVATPMGEDGGDADVASRAMRAIVSGAQATNGRVDTGGVREGEGVFHDVYLVTATWTWYRTLSTRRTDEPVAVRLTLHELRASVSRDMRCPRPL